MSVSVMVNVEIEVEVFYTMLPDGHESVNAICQTNVPREVSLWAEQQALVQFDKNPPRALQFSP